MVTKAFALCVFILPRLFDHLTSHRYSASRSGNNPGRVKRVVSCKRKTHHLTVARRKQLGSGRTFDAANKENEMSCLQDGQQEIFDMDPLEFPLNVNHNHRTGRTGYEQADCSALSEVRRSAQYVSVLNVGGSLTCSICLNPIIFFSSQRITER